MKGELIYKILDSLKNGVFEYVDFTNAFLKTGYGATGSKIRYEFHRIQNKRINEKFYKVEIRKFKKYLSKLKNDGLILENNSKQIINSRNIIF